MKLSKENLMWLRAGQIKMVDNFVETINSAIFHKTKFFVRYVEEKDLDEKSACFELIIYENEFVDDFGGFSDLPKNKGLFAIDKIYKEIVEEMDYMNVQEEIDKMAMAIWTIKQFSGQNINW